MTAQDLRQPSANAAHSPARAAPGALLTPQQVAAGGGAAGSPQVPRSPAPTPGASSPAQKALMQVSGRLRRPCAAAAPIPRCADRARHHARHHALVQGLAAIADANGTRAASVTLIGAALGAAAATDLQQQQQRNANGQDAGANATAAAPVPQDGAPAAARRNADAPAGPARGLRALELPGGPPFVQQPEQAILLQARAPWPAGARPLLVHPLAGAALEEHSCLTSASRLSDPCDPARTLPARVRRSCKA